MSEQTISAWIYDPTKSFFGDKMDMRQDIKFPAQILKVAKYLQSVILVF